MTLNRWRVENPIGIRPKRSNQYQHHWELIQIRFIYAHCRDQGRNLFAQVLELRFSFQVAYLELAFVENFHENFLFRNF